MQAPDRRAAQQRPLARPLSVVSLQRAVAAFLAAGLVVVVAVGAVLALVQQRAAVRQAVEGARVLTERQVRDAVLPALTSAALVPGPEQAELDRIVRERVLGDRILRVKVWAEDGRVVYSDDADLVGHRFTLGPPELAALRQGSSVAEVSDLDAAENAGEAHHGALLQVYLGLRTQEGQPVLLETYQPYAGVVEASRERWLAGLPVLLGGLALLHLLQAPLAYRMASRLRATQEERERLLVAALASADRERSRISSELHDGVVQGLAGTSYALTAVACEVRDAGQPQLAERVHAAAVELRRWVRDLRGLIVSVAPPGDRRPGLEPALVDLLAVLDARGVRVELVVDGVLDVDEQTEALVYRVVQEAVRNVVRHAHASSVHVEVRGEEQQLEVVVRDDGRGFRPDDSGRSPDGLGLELLAGLVAARGGRLEVRSAPGEGAAVRLLLPVHAPPAADPPDVLPWPGEHGGALGLPISPARRAEAWFTRPG